MYVFLALAAASVGAAPALQAFTSTISDEEQRQRAVAVLPQAHGFESAHRIQTHKPLIIIDASIADQTQLAVAIEHALHESGHSTEVQAATGVWARQDYQLGQLLDLGTAQVYILESQRDAIEQVSALLAGYRNIPQLHYFSHARAGQLQLGELSLTAANFSIYQSALAGWGKSLSASADVLFYGCELAQDLQGKALVDRLAQALQAQVRASTDITGVSTQGGNWDLEYSSGVSSQVASRNNNAVLNATSYQASLAVGGTGPDDDFDGDGVLNKNDQDEDNDGVLSQQELDCGNGSLSKPFTSLSQINSATVSGRYYFDPDKNGANLFQANVDNSNGGGWVLALQYVRKDGSSTTSTTVIGANANFPVNSTAVLGTDESTNTTTWGHAGNAAMTQFTDINEIRFYGTTSAHSRVIHFKTPLGVSYIRTGSGSFSGVNSNHTQLSGHTANLPASSDFYYSDQGDFALTVYPYYTTGSYLWSIFGMHWMVDNASNSNTIHKVWVRSTGTASCDSDSDTVGNRFDLDSDNDSISDLLEAGSITVSDIAALAASNPTGKYAGAVNAQGIPTAANNGGGYTRGTGTNLDADGDGLPDAIEAQPTAGYASVNEGSVNFQGITNNGAGLFNPRDTDNDATSDFLDTDSDNDSLLDSAERTSAIVATYASTDGGVNPLTLKNTQRSNTAEVDYRESPPATLTLQKVVINNSGGTATISAWTLTAASASQTISGKSGTTNTTSVQVMPGTYTISEAGDLTTYAQTGLSCSGATLNSNTIVLDISQIATCTITNDDLEPASLTIVKDAGAPSGNIAGSSINYTFTVTNTGGYVMNNLLVNDFKMSNTVSCPQTSLSPTVSMLCSAAYTVTQADVDAGQILNTATVSGNTPSGTLTVSEPSTKTVTFTQTSSITLNKAGSLSSNVAGGTIRYTFTVANTGNVTLNTIRVFDNKLNQTLTISGSLAPGQSTSTIGTYTLTQSDVNAGQVINTASVSALSPNSTAVSSNDSAVTAISSSPAISLDKVAGSPSSNSAGSTIRYTFTVANTGNVTLNTIRVFDNKLNQTLTISGSLAPGQSTSTIGTYTLTQSDVNAGQVINTATVNALSPNSTQVGSSDSAVTAISSSPAITLDKVAGSPSSNAVGGTIRYTFTVANTGNVNLDTIRVFDNKLNQTLTISGSLAPGQSTSTIGTYTLTQSDVNAGQVINTASVSALSPNSTVVSSSDSAVTAISSAPAISLDKVAGSPSSNSAGSTIRYTFTVANTGNVTLSSINVFDNKLNQTLTISGSLTPGQSTSTIGTYTLTQSDVNAGQVINTASVSALSPNSTAVSSNDSAVTSISSSPAISLDKVAGSPSSNSAGSTIRYTFTVANTGNVTLNTIRVFDNKLNQTLTISGSLTPGQSTSTIGTYTLTQSDVNAGQVINTASVSALSPNSTAVSSNDSAVTSISSSPAISLDKVAGSPSSNAVGGTIRYTFTVANTGNVNLDTIRVFDNKLNQTLTISGSLTPGQSTSTIGTYTLTQSDVNAGQVINTASVSALSPNSTAVSSNDSAVTSISSSPAISLDKVAGSPSSNAVGGTIRYTFTVANTGNVTLNTIRVFDNKLNQTLTISGSLAPGQSTSTIGTYTLTQSDVNAGQVINTATVNALSPNSTQVGSSDSAVTAISSAPAISLDKVAGSPSSNAVGGTIRYTFTVANTGNVNLDTIRVFDNKLNQTLTISGSLAPGQSTSTIGTYTLTQSDVNAGQVINTASVSALSPNSTVVSSSDSAVTAISSAPAISLDKVAGSPSSNSAGSTIRYTFTVANTGNVTLSSINVFDNKLNQTLTISGSLTPGQSTSTIGTYTLTQSDVNAGQVINTASVSALSPNSTAVSSNDSAVTSISSSPAISLDKVAGSPSSNSAGSTIRYTFTVANTGNVTLNTIRVFDNKLNQTLTISGSLTPGQSTSTIGTYTLTQSDVNAGQVINTASVSALSPNSTAVSSNDSAVTSISSSPAISLDKVAGSPSSNAVGGTIRYTFTVANTGNVNLDTIRVFDNKLNQTLTISGSLTPGQSTSTIGTYTLTQSDVNAGQVINTASVSALSPNSTAVSSNDSAVTSISSSPAISLDKVAGSPSSNAVGGTIRYTFTVANTGNVTLNTIRVFDNKLNQTLTISGSLAPGQSTSTTATYILTQADVNAGQVINTATVSALSPNSTQVTSSDSAVTAISSAPAISLDKVAGSPSSNAVGGTIRYTFTVANTGNVNLDTIRVFDNKLNQTLTISGSLAPGQSTSTTATYILTQADVNAGQVINTATVSALSPNSTQVGSNDSAVTSISSSPAISLDKVAGSPSSNAVGGTIRYTFTVANTGNVTLSSINVFDNKLNQTLTISGSLTPGQSTSTIGTYTVTQSDINAGQVINTASVSALSPNSTAVSSSDSVTVGIKRMATIIGTIWLDEDDDSQIDDEEYGISGYSDILYMMDPEGSGEWIMLDTELSDSAGHYQFIDLMPNQTYKVEVYDSNGVLVKVFPVLPDQVEEGETVQLLLPIDPSGVIYDSISLAPIAGVIVNLRHKSTGALYADRCLTGSKRQGQVTGSDGRYEFFVNIADASCLSSTDVLTLEVIPVLGYSRSVNIPVRAGAVNQGDCTVGGSSVDAVAGTRMCEIQAQSMAPVSTATTATPYYLDFIIPDSTARDVLHNHIPLDPPRPLAQADTYTVSAGGIVTASVVANDEINPYLVGSPTYTVEIVTGTVSDSNNGTLTLASNGLMRYEAPLGTVLPVTFTYRITQNDGNTTQAQVRILLTASDHVLFNVTKQVNKKAVSIGDVVRYQIEINPRETYTQSMTVSMVDRLPAGLSLVADSLRLTQISGSGVRGAAVAMANGSQASGQIKVSWAAELGTRYELTYFVRINAGATLGEKSNRAQLWDTASGRRDAASGSVISNLAQVSIEIEEDSILDKLTVLGKVFNDVNQNGAQDEALGEQGMPGVRVISLSGEIITTDAYGRFHVPAVSAGERDHGRNYLLKVDVGSLPEGYVFTTENPQVLRITPGLLTRMNFGVCKPLRVKAALKFKVIENCTSKNSKQKYHGTNIQMLYEKIDASDQKQKDLSKQYLSSTGKLTAKKSGRGGQKRKRVRKLYPLSIKDEEN